MKNLPIERTDIIIRETYNETGKAESKARKLGGVIHFSARTKRNDYIIEMGK